MGNSRYPHAPLRNPVNDAKGMAEALRSVGFEATLLLEATRSAMRDAIREYTGGLAKTKAVGLFYFAGHGAQLAWRNYLIPVEAEIADVHELREHAIDVNSLIEGIRAAGAFAEILGEQGRFRNAEIMARAATGQPARALAEFQDAVGGLLFRGRVDTEEESVSPGQTWRLTLVLEGYIRLLHDMRDELRQRGLDPAAEAFRVADAARARAAPSARLLRPRHAPRRAIRRSRKSGEGSRMRSNSSPCSTAPC